MAENKFQKEWIAVHLLFPNSAQARDIFLYVISEVRKNNSAIDYNIYYLKRIIQIFLKTPAIQSMLSFTELENEKFKKWPEYYKKLSKTESVYVVAALFYQSSVNEIASLFKSTQKNTELQIKKSIYKIIPKPEYKSVLNTGFKFKKYNSDNESDFFIYDHIIDYVLNPNCAEGFKTQKKISEDVRFKKYYEQIISLQSELLQLDNRIYELPIQKTPDPDTTMSSDAKLNQNLFNGKKNIGYAGIVMTAILVFMYRPLFLQEALNKKNVETIEIQQIKIDRHKDDGSLAVAQMAPDAKIETVRPKTEAAAVVRNDQAPEIMTDKKTADDAVTKKSAPVEKIKTGGGVFRGKLYVTDVQTVINVVKEKIIVLGGQKAGEVELGWMKNETTSYFHFSFPNENKADLEDYLKQFGKIELVFEPHPRVMPKGIQRYIIEIKQNE